MSITDKALHFAAQADNALFNNPIANALSTQTDAAFARVEQGVVNGASGATRAFLDAEYNPNANLFFSFCAKVSGQWEAARQALGSYVEHRQGGEITQDIIVEGAMQLAQENLGCENANDNKESLKTAVLAQAKRELARSLSEASAPAAGADAKPTNAQQILQTANDATRTAGRLGARYVALNAGAYAISFVSPVVAFLAYYTLGTLDIAGAAKNYVSPSRTENGKTLTEAEVTIITQKVKAAAAGFNGVTNWNADSLAAYENELSNVSRKDLVDAAQRWAAAHPRNVSASDASFDPFAPPSSAAATSSGSASSSASSSSLSFSRRHMYDVKPDGSPRTNPEHLATMLEASETKYGKIASKQGSDSEAALKELVEIRKIAYELALYSRKPNVEIRTAHDAVFVAEEALLRHQGKDAAAYAKRIAMFESRAQYFMAEEDYDNALDAKCTVVGVKKQKAEAEYGLIRNPTAEDKLDLQIVMAEYDVEEAGLVAQHFSELEDEDGIARAANRLDAKQMQLESLQEARDSLVDVAKFEDLEETTAVQEFAMEQANLRAGLKQAEVKVRHAQSKYDEKPTRETEAALKSAKKVCFKAKFDQDEHALTEGLVKAQAVFDHAEHPTEKDVFNLNTVKLDTEVEKAKLNISALKTTEALESEIKEAEEKLAEAEHKLAVHALGAQYADEQTAFARHQSPEAADKAKLVAAELSLAVEVAKLELKHLKDAKAEADEIRDAELDLFTAEQNLALQQATATVEIAQEKYDALRKPSLKDEIELRQATLHTNVLKTQAELEFARKTDASERKIKQREEAHVRAQHAESIYKKQTPHLIAQREFNEIEHPSLQDKNDLVEARLTFELEAAQLEINLQTALGNDRAKAGTELAAAEAEHKLARFKEERVAVEEEARLQGMKNPSREDKAASLTRSLQARRKAALVTLKHCESIEYLNGQGGALEEIAGHEYSLTRVEQRDATSQERDAALCGVWVEYQQKLIDLYTKHGLEDAKVKASLEQFDYRIQRLELTGGDAHDLKVEKWNFAKAQADALRDHSLEREASLNLAVLQPDYPADAEDAAKAEILAKANNTAYRHYVRSDLEVAFRFLQAEVEATKIAVRGADAQEALARYEDLQGNYAAYARYISQELAGLDRNDPKLTRLKAVEQEVLLAKAALSKEIEQLARQVNGGVDALDDTSASLPLSSVSSPMKSNDGRGASSCSDLDDLLGDLEDSASKPAALAASTQQQDDFFDDFDDDANPKFASASAASAVSAAPSPRRPSSSRRVTDDTTTTTQSSGSGRLSTLSTNDFDMFGRGKKR